MTATAPGPPTLRDVARRAGMSVSTASRALNADPTVAPTYVARAKAAAHDLGYAPNVAARALRGSLNVVSMLSDDIGTEAVAQTATALEAVANSMGVVVTLSSAGGEPRAQASALRQLLALRPRALVLTGRWLRDEEIRSDVRCDLDAFIESGGRVVTIGPTEFAGDSVEFDDYGAGLAVGRHMASVGGRSAVILAGLRTHHAFSDRTRGFTEALARGGIGDIRTLHSPVTRDDAARLVARAIEQRVPDLVLGGNDRLALGAMRALARHGLRIPEDVAVSGIDDIAVAADTSPPLTTFALPFAGAGEVAARLALTPAPTATHVKLSGALVARRSSNRVYRME